jgi:spermidine synthase
MNAYSGLFILSAATLALEIAMVRLLSVTTWYYLAFFAISTAMLGLTSGAVFVYLRPPAEGKEAVDRSLARSASGFAAAVPVTLVLLCLLPLPITRSVMTLLAAVVTGLVAALPFFFTGIATTIALTRTSFPVGRMYAADLAGAAAGAVIGLVGLESIDTPSVILVTSGIGFVAAMFFEPPSVPHRRRGYAMAAVALAAIAALNTQSVFAIRPLVVKGGIDRPENILVERWNSYSRVVVFPPVVAAPQLWGPSPKMPAFDSEQYEMKIDGAAGTMLRRFSTPADLEHLKYDVTNIAYFLRREGSVCVIGVGGGRDIQSAVAFGRRPILGVELNPIFVDLLNGQFRDVAGVAGRPEVTLVSDEARTYLARDTRRFDLIQMSMIDTWAATGAGAFALSENGLYTIEAWSLFFSRLSDDGIFTVARFFNPRDLSETGRVMSLATAVLLANGVSNPADHLALVTSGTVSALVMSKRPFDAADLTTLSAKVAEYGYGLAYAPGHSGDPLLSAIANARSRDELSAAVADHPLNLTPPTDNNPYFFNMLRLSHFRQFLRTEPGVVRGNLVATGTLVVLIGALAALTVGLVLAPLAFRARLASRTGDTTRPRLTGVLYFMAVGAAFMFVELGLVQRLSVFLGHPVYAMGVILATIIACAGLGAFVSERIAAPRPSSVQLLALGCAVLALLCAFLSDWVAETMAESGLAARILATILLVAPVGTVMGLFVPLGLRFARRIHGSETPWYWALNGIVSVLSSALTVLVAITSGVHANFYIGALMYALAGPLLASLARDSRT